MYQREEAVSMGGERTGAARRWSVWRSIARGGRLRPLLVALACCAAGFLGALAPLLDTSASAARACGLVNTPTMLANSQPSVLLPKPGGTLATPITGFFASDYVAGQPVTFKEDLSNMVGAPPADTLQWRWVFGDGGTASGITAAHTFTKPGKYTIFSQVLSGGSWDDDFDSAYLTVIAAAPAQPPVVVATSSAIITDPNTPIVFNASDSRSADGSPLTYYWNFADYTTSSDSRVTHPFSAYLVSQTPSIASVITLVVTDKSGAQAVKYFDIEVVQQLPDVSLDSSATSVSTGQTVTFTASATLPPTPTPTTPAGPPSGTQAGTPMPVQYQWNFGDGSTPLTTTVTSVTHTFQKGGSFRVTVQGLDQRGFVFPSAGTITISVDRDWTSLVLAVLGGLIVVVGGFFLVRGQIRRNRLIRERAAAMALARARAVQADRDRRTQARMRAVQQPPRPGSRYGPPPRGPGGPS
jgi:plastocyanin